MLPSFWIIMLLATARVAQGSEGLEDVVHQLLKEVQVQAERIQYLESIMIPKLTGDSTIEELGVRVERLEEGVHQVQGDIIDNQGTTNSLQFSVQETKETVMEFTDKLDQIGLNINNIANTANDLDGRVSRTEQLNLATKDSAFYTTLSTYVTFGSGLQIIPFDNVKFNDGGRFNPLTGQYTASVNGIYYFYAYVQSSPKANVGVYVNGAVYANPVENYFSENENEAEGVSILVRLTAGQTVDVRTGNVPYTVAGNPDSGLTWFGGYLLFSD